MVGYKLAVMSSSDEASSPLNPDIDKKRLYSEDVNPGKLTRKRSHKLSFCLILLLLLVITLLVLCAVILALVLHRVVNSNSNTEPWKSRRLPSSIKPETYDITLAVDLNALTVNGEENITVSLQEKSTWILLQYSNKDMNISDVKVFDANDPVKSGWDNYTENEYLIITNKDGNFATGKVYTVFVKFSYYLYSGGLSGFYNSTYTENGKPVILATTQFEPTSARKAFPCFDEPAMKANFTITIVHPANTTALSNMQVKSQENVNGNIVTHFATSVRMSTYLVAFIVCEFKSMSTLVDNRVNVSVWSRPSLVNDTEYALNITVIVLRYYETFFGIEYPLKKLDLVAIPDFAAGAMENWGLITYRETALLVTPGASSASDKQWVTQVIAHELAHQWFGNLVTMEWWQDLWLNEGFATYIEYLGTYTSHAEWNFLDFFIVGDLHLALEVDGYNETHPIIQPAETLSEINALFDTISYSKGASLIRMIVGFMGMDKFKEGLNKYLTAHSYGNAQSSDLWDALQAVVNDPDYNLTSVMDTWTVQGGYPVLNVTLVDGCAKLSIQQERFVIVPTNPEDFAKSEFNYIWSVPFNFITNNSANPSITAWIDKESDEIQTGQQSCSWLKANFGDLGFYRVNYHQQQWNALTNLLNTSHTTLQTADRANLVDDAVSLSIAGYITPVQALDLVSYLKRETDYVALRVGLLSLSQIHGKIRMSRVEGKFSKYILCLLESEIQSAVASFPGAIAGHLENLKRSLVLKYALLYGNSTFASLAYTQFESYMKSGQEPTPDLKDVILTAGIREGGSQEWEFLWNKYIKSQNPTEQATILSALAYAKQPWLIQLYLSRSLKEVRSQDGLTVLRRLANNEYAWPYLWSFFKNNYDELFKRYGESLSFGRAITASIGHFTTQNQLEEVESFFADRDAGSGLVALKSGIEQIKSNIQWLDDNLDSLEKWFEGWFLINC